MSELKNKLFKGIPQPDQIEEAVCNRDTSYIRGVMKYYEKQPPRGNEVLVPFLRECLHRFSSAYSSS